MKGGHNRGLEWKKSERLNFSQAKSRREGPGQPVPVNTFSKQLKLTLHALKEVNYQKDVVKWGLKSKPLLNWGKGMA